MPLGSSPLWFRWGSAGGAVAIAAVRYVVPGAGCAVALVALAGCRAAAAVRAVASAAAHQLFESVFR